MVLSVRVTRIHFEVREGNGGRNCSIGGKCVEGFENGEGCKDVEVLRLMRAVRVKR